MGKQIVMWHMELEMANYERETVEEVMSELMAFVTKNENGEDVDVEQIEVHQDKESELWYGRIYYLARRRVRL